MKGKNKLAPCPHCGSRKWRSNKDGFYICSRGHQANIVEEVGDDAEFIGSQRRTASIRGGRKKTKSKREMKKGRRRTVRSVRAEILQNLLLRQVEYLINEKKFPVEFEEILVDLWMMWVTAKKVTFADQRVVSDSEFDSRSEIESEDGGHISDFSIASTVSTSGGQTEPDELQAPVQYATDGEEDDAIAETKDSEWELHNTLAFLHLAARALRLPITLGHFHQWSMNGELPLFEANLDIESLRGSAMYYMITKSIDKIETSEKRLEKLFETHFGLSIPKDEPTVHVIRFMHALSLPAEFYMFLNHSLILLYGAKDGYDLAKCIALCVVLCKSSLVEIQVKEKLQKISFAEMCPRDLDSVTSLDIEKYAKFASSTISSTMMKIRTGDLITMSQALLDHKRRLRDRVRPEQPTADPSTDRQLPVPTIPNTRTDPFIIQSYDPFDVDGLMDPFDFQLILVASHLSGFSVSRVEREVRRVEVDILKMTQIIPEA